MYVRLGKMPMNLLSRQSDMAGNTEERTKPVADRVPATGAAPSSGSGTRTILTTMPEVREAVKVKRPHMHLLHERRHREHDAAGL